MASGYTLTDADKAAAQNYLASVNSSPTVPSRFSGPQPNPDYVPPPTPPQAAPVAPPAPANQTPVPDNMSILPPANMSVQPAATPPAAANTPPAVANTPPPPSGQVPQTPPNPLAIPGADITQGPEGKDARANIINSKYDDAKAKIEEQLNVEQSQIDSGSTTGNPNKVAALKVQLHQNEADKASALQTNQAAFDAVWKLGDDGKMHVGAIPKSLSPQQIAKLKLTSQTVEEGNQDADFKKQQEAMQAETDAKVAQDKVNSAGLLQIAAQKQQDANDKIQRQQVFQTQLKQKQDEADLAMKKYNDSSIDENRFWSKTPVGNQIGLAILAGLTGAFNGLNHVAGNSVVDRVNSLIANDIDQQKTELAKKGKSVDNANNAVAAFQKQGYDLEQSVSMAKAAMMDATISKVQAEASKYNNPQIQAQAAQATAQLAETRDKERASVLTPYINNNIQANQAVAPGAGANSGFITSMVGGKLQVKNVKTGQISDANDDQKARYYATEKTRAETAKTEASAGAPPKQNGRITQILATSSGIPKLTAAVKEPYSSGGLNTFSTTNTDSKLNQWASAISAATKVPVDVIIHNVKNPILNSSSEQIIDHYAKDAEDKREYYEKNPSAVPGAGESEDVGETGNGG
jgi:hypothetical protein